MKQFLFTKEGLEEIKKELKELKEVKRKEIIERIKESRSYGDLAENSEYADAKNEQAFVEGRILELENILKKAKIIPERKCHKVSLGCQVQVKGKWGEETFILVNSAEVDLKQGKISLDSPIGQAMLNKKVGDNFIVETPSGKIEYKILSIK